MSTSVLARAGRPCYTCGARLQVSQPTPGSVPYLVHADTGMVRSWRNGRAHDAS